MDEKRFFKALIEYPDIKEIAAVVPRPPPKPSKKDPVSRKIIEKMSPEIAMTQVFLITLEVAIPIKEEPITISGILRVRC